MEQFFPAGRIVKTGNPVRRESVNIKDKRELAFKEFNLSPHKKTILVIGGSLGARTLNTSAITDLQKIIDADVQLIWQTGKYYFDEVKLKIGSNNSANIRVLEFLNRMDLAYAAADVIISRAGAGTIAELCVIGKPVILVPSPNVAEDHQTKNAKALVKDEACELVADRKAVNELIDTALVLLNDEKRKKILSENISKLALPNADEDIAKEVIAIGE
jgi:UDP-N-acetylglucosamine--N-acetylmuramyl-(pentapeptide) pyrophosphoryl-undecaprenol N-acetylglucosamine transferase